jgi:hypothetical protein
MKQTMQAVCAVKQSIFLRCLWLLALPSNIRQDWKGLSGTNAVAYYENL